MRGVGRRFGGLHAVREVDLDIVPGERRAILGPNGAGKTTLFNVICGDFPASTGTVELFGGTSRTSRRGRAAGSGLARTYQQSRLFLGLTVEDNIYLSVLGVEGGHLRPVILPRTPRSASGRARPPAGSRSSTSSASWSARSRTASTGRWRSRWRSRPSRGC